MKTHYSGHDEVYKKLKDEASQGWATTEQVNEYLAILDKTLNARFTPNNGKLLELGCGDGANIISLGKRGHDLYGVDIAPTAIEWAKEKAKNNRVKADFQLGNVLDLKNYYDNYFDFVLDGHCFHCIIGEDRNLFLSSVFRVLKRKGFFHVCTMCGEITSTELQKQFDLQSRCLIRNDVAIRYIGFPDDILDEIRDSGFEILHWEIEPRKDQEELDDLVVVAVKP